MDLGYESIEKLHCFRMAIIARLFSINYCPFLFFLIPLSMLLYQINHPISILIVLFSKIIAQHQITIAFLNRYNIFSL